ncbi:MAG: chromosome partitioning protein ParB, partial [Flavobacteriaceae bacterium]|nr:chromosome partitioning protein ParB [Flavobacteriaceae bacterium]
RAIINIEDLGDQLDIYEKVITENLSVRATEALVRNLKSPSAKKISEKKADPVYIKTAKKQLSELLESKVSVKVNDTGKGQMTIPFKNKKDFLRILNLLKSEK